MATIVFSKLGNLTGIKYGTQPTIYYSVANIEINNDNAGFRLLDENRHVLFSIFAADTVQYNGSTLGGNAEGILEQLAPVFSNANSGTGGTGLTYTCKLYQFNDNNPFDATMEGNTISGYIGWSRVDTGTYNGYLPGAFPEHRTRFVHAGITPEKNFVSISRTNDDNISVIVTDLESFVPADGELNEYDLQIVVYPSYSFND